MLPWKILRPERPFLLPGRFLVCVLHNDFNDLLSIHLRGRYVIYPRCWARTMVKEVRASLSSLLVLIPRPQTSKCFTFRPAGGKNGLPVCRFQFVGIEMNAVVGASARIFSIYPLMVYSPTSTRMDHPATLHASNITVKSVDGRSHTRWENQGCGYSRWLQGFVMRVRTFFVCLTLT